MDKTVATPAQAVADVPDGASLAVGGFGLCGIPSELIAALHDRGVGGLRTVSNNCGVDDWGLGILLSAHRIARTTGSGDGKSMSATQRGRTSAGYLRHLLLLVWRRSMTRSKSWAMIFTWKSSPGETNAPHPALSPGGRGRRATLSPSGRGQGEGRIQRETD